MHLETEVRVMASPMCWLFLCTRHHVQFSCALMNQFTKSLSAIRVWTGCFQILDVLFKTEIKVQRDREVAQALYLKQSNQNRSDGRSDSSPQGTEKS